MQQEKRRPFEAQGKQAAALQNGYHRNFQIDSGRRHARGLAVHIRALDRLQFAMHLVRYGVRVSWREEDEGRGRPGARRWNMWAPRRKTPRTNRQFAGVN